MFVVVFVVFVVVVCGRLWLLCFGGGGKRNGFFSF